MTRAAHNDRVGGARNDDRQAGKGTHPPNFHKRPRPHAKDGCGNGVPMESKERFPQELGNLAQNARFPHFHSRSSVFLQEKNKSTKNTAATSRRQINRPQASRILGHIEDRQE